MRDLAQWERWGEWSVRADLHVLRSRKGPVSTHLAHSHSLADVAFRITQFGRFVPHTCGSQSPPGWVETLRRSWRGYAIVLRQTSAGKSLPHKHPLVSGLGAASHFLVADRRVEALVLYHRLVCVEADFAIALA